MKLWTALPIAILVCIPELLLAEPIKIGFIGSLTGPDPMYGAAARGGVEVAVSEVNAKGGVSGVPLKVIYEDGKCIDGIASVTAARRLIDIERVPAILGGGCSTEVLAIAPIVNASHTVVLTSGASSPNVSESGPFIFRNTINDAETSKVLARRLVRDGHKRIGIVSEQTDYSEGFRSSFVQELSLHSLLPSHDIMLPAAERDLRVPLFPLRKEIPDAIFVNPNTPGVAADIVRRIREFNKTVPLYLAFQTTEVFLKAAGSAADNLIVINFPLRRGDLPTAVLGRVKALNGTESAYPFITLASYDATKLIAEALTHGAKTGDEIRAFLANLGEREGAIGTFKFDMNGDITGMEYRFQRINAGAVADE